MNIQALHFLRLKKDVTLKSTTERGNASGECFSSQWKARAFLSHKYTFQWCNLTSLFCHWN